MNAWHADPRDLRAWVDGDAGMALGASIEQHLIDCAGCRLAVAGLVDARSELRAAVDSGRRQLIATIQAPPLGPIPRLLARLGVPVADIHAVRSAATPGIVWLFGTALTLGFLTLAAVFGAGNDGGAAFLAVAPLVPVAGVALLCGPATEPTYEIVVAAPYPLIRMVLLRALGVVVMSVPATLVAGLLLPLPAGVATLWLLPAAGFIIAVLAASTWLAIERAAAGVASLWLAAVVLTTRRGAFSALLDSAAVGAYLALAIAAALVLAYRISNPRSAIRLR